MTMTTVEGRSKLWLFFLASLLAWVIWVPQALHRFELIGWAPSLQSPLNALTVWAPGLAAIFVLLHESGASGVKELFGRLRLWKVGVGWYIVALCLEPARWLAALGLDRALGRSYELGPGLLHDAFGAASVYMIPVAVVFTLPNALGEELGWRGFALPRFQAKRGALVATLGIGLFWGFWHIPAWIAWGSAELSWFPIGLMVVSTLPAAVVFTWLFNRTGGSLWVPIVYHASIANKGYFLSDLPTYTETALLWLIAAVLVIGGWLAPPRREESEGMGSESSSTQSGAVADEP